MKSGYLRCVELDTNKEVHQIVTFDETQKCLLCDRPVRKMSMAGTAICGQCDTGASYRQGRRQRHYKKGEMPSVWCNVKEHWEFPTREEAEKKMYDLHLQGIEGWPHVIEKFTREKSDGL
jgi:hypothetical protein